MTTRTSYGPLVTKEELKLPWICCLWCNYKDKIEFDLAQHMYEKHRGGETAIDDNLLKIPIYSRDRKITKALSGNFFSRFEPAIEFRLDVAVEMAKDENRDKGVKYAIKQIQKRTLAKLQPKKLSTLVGVLNNVMR